MAIQSIQNTSDIAALRESLKSAHKRIDENDRMTEGIHKLAANVEALALQVKMLTGKMDESINRIEAGLKSQGERIGAIENEPAHKWKTLVAQVTGLVVAAVIGVIIAKFL
jgi:hypothetical protein